MTCARKHGVLRMTVRPTLTERAHHAATMVLAPHMGEDVARERAAQLAVCFDPEAVPGDEDIRHCIAAARLRHYGGLELSDDEVESLTQRVALALGGVR